MIIKNTYNYKDIFILRNILFVILGVCILIPLIIQMLHPLAYVDSGYYLSISNRICDGYKLYDDIACAYTPLHLYLCSAYRILFDIPFNTYWPYLLLQQFFRVGCAYFLYCIAKEFQSTTTWALVSAFYCLFLLMRVEGTQVLLEVPSSFWGLAACLVTLKVHSKNPILMLFAGLLVSFSYLTKQYGLGFLPLVLYILTCYSPRNKIHIRIMYVLVGFLIPIVFCFIYFGDKFIDVLLPSYGTQTAINAGFDWTITDRIKSVLLTIVNNFKTTSAIVLLSIFLFPLSLKSNEWKSWLFTLLGFMGFSLQFYFTNTSGGHYLLYMFPFSALTISNVTRLNYNKFKSLMVYMCISYMILWQSYKMFCNYIPYWLYDRYEKESITSVTDICNKFIPPKSVVWIEPVYLESVYFYADILPPNLPTIGYAFGPLGIDYEMAKVQYESAEYIIFHNGDKHDYTFSQEILDKCAIHELIYQSESITLFKKNKYENTLQ